MQVDGPTTTAPETAPESPPPGAVMAPVDVFAGPGRGTEAATIGQGRARRRWGLAGQYTVLCLLALVVLVPIVFAVIQALSPPFKYVDAGKPLHPVSVDWKTQGWLAGGAVSIVLRTAVVAVALAWVQLRVAGGRMRDLALLGKPRRLAPFVAGVVAVAVMCPQIW